MNSIFSDRSVTDLEWQQTVQKTLMRNVYGWMSLALVITAVMAYYTSQSYNLLNFLFASKGIWVLLIAEIALVVILSARIHKISFATAGVLFALYSIVNGMTLSSIFLVYTQSSLTSTFFIAAGTFAGMAVVGSLIKKDLSGIGRIAIMALIGLIIASVVNIFLNNSALDWAISLIGVVIFVALTAYDAQKIKDMIFVCDDVNEQTQKIALLGALSLYLDFINLFLYLLRLFGKRE